MADGESYWSISEAHLPTELGRAPTPREVLERTEAAIAYNAPRLGYDDPKMLHTGDIVFVDAVTLSLAAPAAAAVPEPADPAVAVVTESPADEAASRAAAGAGHDGIDVADRSTVSRRRR